MFAICPLTVVPVRAEPNDRSEMVTQLLFGEKVEILEEKGSWFLCKLLIDSYIGWIDRKQLKPVEEIFVNESSSKPDVISSEIFAFAEAKGSNNRINLLQGSTLPAFSDGKFFLGADEYKFEGATLELPSAFEVLKVAPAALLYLNVPYLWGGRTHAGIDCSGLVQAVFRQCGMQLPRNAAEQSIVGQTVDFIDEAQPGDLAFFNNSSGEIIHTGIVLEKGRIIHASGKVRIDRLDHHGIFNEEISNYSHSLRIIRRLTL